MSIDKVTLSACLECEKIYRPKEAEGLPTSFVQADIEVFKLQEYYQISHGYCNRCYPIVEERMKKEIAEEEKQPKRWWHEY